MTSLIKARSFRQSRNNLTRKSRNMTLQSQIIKNSSGGGGGRGTRVLEKRNNLITTMNPGSKLTVPKGFIALDSQQSFFESYHGGLGGTVFGGGSSGVGDFFSNSPLRNSSLPTSHSFMIRDGFHSYNPTLYMSSSNGQGGQALSSVPLNPECLDNSVILNSSQSFMLPEGDTFYSRANGIRSESRNEVNHKKSFTPLQRTCGNNESNVLMGSAN